MKLCMQFYQDASSHFHKKNTIDDDVKDLPLIQVWLCKSDDLSL